MKSFLEMKRHFSGERESALYNSLTGLVSSTLGMFAIFPASVAKLKFLLSLPGKPALGSGAWALPRGWPVLLNTWTPWHNTAAAAAPRSLA